MVCCVLTIAQKSCQKTVNLAIMKHGQLRTNHGRNTTEIKSIKLTNKRKETQRKKDETENRPSLLIGLDRWALACG